MVDDLRQIKQFRQNLGMTQTELAKLSEVSQSMVAKIEGGRLEPSYSIGRRILSVLEEQLVNNYKTLVAEEVCTKKIIYVSPEDSVKKALIFMKKYAISQLPVMKDNVVVGSISETSLIRNYDKIRNKDIKIGEIMDEPSPVVSVNTPISLVKNMLKVYPAIIVIKKGEKIGIITKADLLRECFVK